MMIERKCSYCGNFGHNSRTCNNNHTQIDGIVNGGGVKLFGVQLELSSCSSSSSGSSSSSSTSLPTQFAMKRSFSMDYLLSSSSSSPNFELIGTDEKNSDKTCLNSTSQQRNKGVAWSEEEHQAFLEGLMKLGKGDWRGISRSFVTTITPSQVASHAQKYFLRQNCFNRRKRRPSFLDAGREESTVEPFNTHFKASDELACGQIGWPSTTTTDLISNNNVRHSSHYLKKNNSISNRISLPPHQWLCYHHHSVLNCPIITTSTNHTTIQSSEGPDLDLKLAAPS